MKMDIRAIRSERDYDWAVREVERYFDKPPRKGSAEAERFDLLTQLIEAYDREHYAVKNADPVEVIESVMEDRGLSQNDLAEILGSRSHASEVLARKRRLSLTMIRAIHAAWKIPADALIGEYEIGKASV